jgi:hypothetical protein
VAIDEDVEEPRAGAAVGWRENLGHLVASHEIGPEIGVLGHEPWRGDHRGHAITLDAGDDFLVADRGRPECWWFRAGSLLIQPPAVMPHLRRMLTDGPF